MAQTKQVSKRRRRRAALPALGMAGVSLSLTGGVSAATTGPATDIPPPGTAPQIAFSEEELADVSLSTFYVFDKENPRTLRGAVQEAGSAKS